MIFNQFLQPQTKAILSTQVRSLSSKTITNTQHNIHSLAKAIHSTLKVRSFSSNSFISFFGLNSRQKENESLKSELLIAQKTAQDEKIARLLAEKDVLRLAAEKNVVRLEGEKDVFDEKLGRIEKEKGKGKG